MVWGIFHSVFGGYSVRVTPDLRKLSPWAPWAPWAQGPRDGLAWRHWRLLGGRDPARSLVWGDDHCVAFCHPRNIARGPPESS